ncbi:FmdB family zinc ribbon protein [uncultured Friedmanniella sp.]|uniref:FmdB family zinc ribbon protein n=1 Tax=uncultured Friedmanniella sp. TaxID=335381 RepID=UPI0035C97A30
MPTYQYRCTECGHDLEAVQKFTDAALTECPNCGGPLRKIYNAVGVVFKGSGFYRTDSRKPEGSDSGSGSGSGEGKSEGKSDTKDGGSGSSTEKSAPTKDTTPAKAPSPAPAASGSSSSSSTGAKTGS